MNSPKHNQPPDQSHLIATKLHPPKLTARFLARPGWAQIIEQVPLHQTTLLSSSAGFGKTTMLLGIHKHLVSLGYRVAWLSLDSDDGQFWRFCDYLIGTLESQGIDMSLASPGIPGENTMAIRDAILAALSNQLINSPAPLFLILDDFHHIEDENVLQLISRLISMPPTNFHLVLATRGQPMLPLAKSRSQGALLEVSTDELRFSEQETRSFMELIGGQSLDKRQLQALQDKTEGWVSALQLVAIALRRRQKTDEYIRSFSGSTQTMAEYLADSVFDSLDKPLQQFLVETSILDRLSDSLCRAVTSISGDQVPLQKLLELNLFIEPLDDEQTWYRYHALFRDYLQARLKRGKTVEIERLHGHARDWYARYGLYDQAVKHAVAANSIENAIDLVERCALSVLSQGRYRTLMQWIEKLPGEQVAKSVKLQMGQAVSLCLSHRLDEAAKSIDNIEKMNPSEQEMGEFATGLPILRALELFFHDRLEEAGELAETWLSNKNNYQTANPIFTITAFNTLAYLRLHQGRLAEARETYVPLGFLPKEMIPAYGWMLRESVIGLSWQQEGKLSNALSCFENNYREAGELLGKRSTTAIQAATSLAELMYQKGQHDFLFDIIESQMEVIDETSMPFMILGSRLNLACAHFSAGNIKLARNILKEGEAIAIRFSWSRLRLAFQSQRMRFATRLHEWGEVNLLQAELEKVQQADHSKGQPVDEIRYFIGIAIGERLLEEQDFHKVIHYLENLCESLEAKHFAYYGFKLRVPLAIALHSAGKTEQALNCFHQTLQIAAEEQLTGAYLEQGDSLTPLLKEYVKTRDSSDNESISTLLATLCERMFSDTPPPVHKPLTAPKKTTAVTLTPDHDVCLGSREVEVLELVAQGLTNKHIARALGIGPETVKWHLKNLYTKLDVRSRVDATQKARRLGIIG